MSTWHDGRLNQCDGKFPHPTRRQAEEWAMICVRECGIYLDVYACQYCPGWHTSGSLRRPHREHHGTRKKQDSRSC